jgi:hypothetical protein
MFLLGCCGYCSGVKPYDHREDHGQGEAACNRSPPGVIGVCFTMFTFGFHVQPAAMQHRTCREYVESMFGCQLFVSITF